MNIKRLLFASTLLLLLACGDGGDDSDICFLIYAPVCGIDGNTYDNDCFAEEAGVEVLYEGVCD